MLDSISSETLAVIFLVALILLYQRRQAFVHLLKTRMRVAEPERVERSSVPAQTAQLLDIVRQELEAAGFRHEFTQARLPLNLFDPRPLEYSDCYWHPDKSTLAIARLAEPYTGQAVSVTLLTTCTDGKRLETVNRLSWALIPLPDDYIVQDAYADNFQAQWEFHLKALEQEAARRTIIDSLDETLRLEQGSLSRMFDNLRTLGMALEETPGVFRFTLKGAWRLAHQQLREAKKVRAKLRQPYRHSQTPDAEALRGAEMNAFATSTELAAQPLPRWLKVVLFGVTLLASIVLFGRQITFVGASALLLVLLVHELGHLIAMWAYGFRNLSILFLPFFGAVAMGHKTHVKPWQEVVILLAGPVPGLIAALLLSQLPVAVLSPDMAEFLRMTFWFALVLNLFNLLPISILDGGKLFQLAVLSRFPYTRVIFGVAGSAIGLVYAVMNGSTVLAIAMAMVLMGTLHQLRAARAVSAIRSRTRGIASLSKEQAISLLGQHLARPEFNEASTKGWVRRNMTATIAYPRLLQGVPGLFTSLGILAVHSLAFFAPILMAFWLLHQPSPAPILRENETAQAEARSQQQVAKEEENRATREQFMARYNAERNPEAKWDMLDWNEDEQGNLLILDPDWVRQQQSELRNKLPADNPEILRLLLGKAEPGNPHATEITLSVITRLTRGDARKAATLDPRRFGILMGAYDRLLLVAKPDALAKQAGRMNECWQALDVSSGESWRKQAVALTAAHFSISAGNQSDAEKWMDRYLASSDGRAQSPTALTHAWFLLDTGHADHALELAILMVDSPVANDYMRNHWRALAGWAEMARGHPREADAYFQAALQPPKQKKEQFNVAVWLIELIQGRPSLPSMPPMISEPMLDHLAALESYDPQEAARYRAELAAMATPAWRKYAVPDLPNMLGGWGKARAAALGKLAKSL